MRAAPKRAESGPKAEARHAIVGINGRRFSKPPALYAMGPIRERIPPDTVKKDPEDAFRKFSDAAPRGDRICCAVDAPVEIGKAKRNGGSCAARYRQLGRPRKEFARLRWEKLARRGRRSAKTLRTGGGQDRA